MSPEPPVAPSGADEVGVLDFTALPPVPPPGRERAAWWLARSRLGSQEGERFVSLVTLISILGVVVGVALLDAVLSVMTGFEVDLRDKILGANAHVVVMRHGGELEVDEALLSRVEAVPGVAHVAPFTYGEVMLRSRMGVSGVILKGVDPLRTGEVTAVRDQITMGLGGPIDADAARRDVFAALGADVPGRGDDEVALPGIVLGDELMADLGVLPGEVVQLVDPIGNGGGILGVPVPKFKQLRVLGAFHSGMFEYDTKWVYVGIPTVQAFVGHGPVVNGLELRVDDVDDVEAISRRVEDALGYPFYVRHWKNLNQSLFEALALEKVVMSLILGMVVVVAGLLIVSNLYTMVLTQRRQIAILKAMGASRGTILRIYVFVGSFIGIVGTVVGTGVGLALCYGLDEYGYPLETDVYLVSSLPVVVQPLDVVVVAVSAFAVCFVSTLYPALRAAALDPVEGLRDA